MTDEERWTAERWMGQRAENDEQLAEITEARTLATLPDDREIYDFNGQPLINHLRAVADGCERACLRPALKPLARWIGLVHDRGKAQPEYQAALRSGRRLPGHQHAGAIFGNNALRERKLPWQPKGPPTPKE